MKDFPYVPAACVWELTLRCNMRCLHCGSRAGKARQNELSLDECRRVADELVQLGGEHVSFIGGEVFFYRDWHQLAKHLTAAGVLVNMITNGYRFTDEHVAQIRDAGLNNVGISVDGLRENHNRIRGVQDSFDHVLAAMAKLREAKIPIAVVTALLDFNVDDLEPLYDLLVAQGVNVWQIQIATGMGNMAAQKAHCLNPAKVPRVTRFIREKRLPQEIRIYAGDDIGYYDEHELYLRNRPGTIAAWQGCQAGLRVVGIDSVGNVKGCESLYDDRFIEGNVRDQSLTKIWRKKGNFAYNRQFDVRQLTGACAACDQAERCRGGCRGACYFTANAMFENPYCCYPGKPQIGAAARPRRSAGRRVQS